MTLTAENELISDMKDIKKLLSAILEQQKNMVMLFSKYDQSYNEEMLGEGHVPR